MIHIDNNAMIAAVKTTYDMLTEREKIIYNLGYRTGLKSNENILFIKEKSNRIFYNY